ncbi:GNAT family N-acetyltransferase [Aureimonas phyllosphaerae]|uniref:GNAT family N-acetyltransferase n=1 Tax=Aureimonas phyllosphaerae TaxID=1166078 RepID=UPI003A5C00C0
MSEPFVRPAGPGDIDLVATFLHRFMNERIEPTRWRRILDDPWRPEGLEHGWLVEHDGRIVGFMATIYSDRRTRFGTRRFCDLGAWYLERSYRGSGLGQELLGAGMQRADTTYVTLTARRATGRRIRALGFSILDDQRALFPPRRLRSHGALRLTDDVAALDEDARRRLADHEGLGLFSAVVEGAGRPALVLLQRKRKGADVLHHDLLHASHAELLAYHAQDLADLLVEEGVLAIDSRFLSAGSGVPLEAIPLPRWFRPVGEIEARDVDLLYNETLLLDLKLP